MESLMVHKFYLQQTLREYCVSVCYVWYQAYRRRVVSVLQTVVLCSQAVVVTHRNNITEM